MNAEMNKIDIESLEGFIDLFGLKEVISKLSFICGEKAEHIATNWQDVKTAKVWMDYSVVLDSAHAKLEDIDAK